MNPIFIYLFSETIGRQWLNGTVAIFTTGGLEMTGASAAVASIVTALATFALEWYLCYWLYRRKILIKI
jgi:predicted acyltransferase